MELESHYKKHNLIINFEDCKVTLSGLWETSGQGLNLFLFVNLACSTGPCTNFSLSKYLWNEYMSV